MKGELLALAGFALLLVAGNAYGRVYSPDSGTRYKIDCSGSSNAAHCRLIDTSIVALPRRTGNRTILYSRWKPSPFTVVYRSSFSYSWQAQEGSAPRQGSQLSPATPISGSFSPGQATAEGQHVVEWTLLAAPIAAYAFSPVIDRRLSYDGHGIWTRKYQLDFEHLVMLTELGGALWYGGKTRIGRTFWRSIDASVFTAITTTAMKYAFSRARPRQSKSPDRWFQGNCCQSFPSGEVSFQASFVTPFIAEYHKQYPWVWALEALPAYDALARMKVHGHWQTDVLAAWAIGTAWGIYAHDEPKGLIIGFMPNGIIMGFGIRF